MLAYITFGQAHTHSVNGKAFDKDTVAVIEAEDYNEAREIAFEAFDNAWCFAYHEDNWDDSCLQHFPKGLVALNFGD